MEEKAERLGGQHKRQVVGTCVAVGCTGSVREMVGISGCSMYKGKEGRRGYENRQGREKREMQREREREGEV